MRPAERTIVQSLVEKQKTITFLKKPLGAVCFLATKQEDRVFIVRIELKTKPDYRCQTVYTPSQIRIASCKVNLFLAGCIIRHGLIPPEYFG